MGSYVQPLLSSLVWLYDTPTSFFLALFVVPSRIAIPHWQVRVDQKFVAALIGKGGRRLRLPNECEVAQTVLWDVRLESRPLILLGGLFVSMQATWVPLDRQCRMQLNT